MSVPTAHATGQDAPRQRELAELVEQRISAFTAGRSPQVEVHARGDVICAVVHDLLTERERLLARGRRHDAVLAMRTALQTAAAPLLIDGVEQITGRRVVALHSDTNVVPDLCVDVFLLEPPGPAAQG